MNSIRKYICSKLCPPKEDIEKLSEVTPQIREASHKMTNAVMELKGSTVNVQRDANAFLALVRALENRNGNNDQGNTGKP